MQKKSSLLAKLKAGDHLDQKKRISDGMKLAARIDDLITERGWTGQRFANLLGKEPSVISKWLSGTHNFTLDTLSDIAGVLEVDLIDLFKDKPHSSVFKTQFAVGTQFKSKRYGGYPNVKSWMMDEASSDINSAVSKDPKLPIFSISGTAGSVVWRTKADIEGDIEVVFGDRYALKA